MVMRKYENLFILDPDLPDEAAASLEEKLKGVVTSNGGTVLKYDLWGKKKLAYPVKKRTRGAYVLIEFAAGSGLVSELERNMRLDERVLKFLTVKLEDRFDPSALVEPEAAPQSAAAAEEAEESEAETEAEETGSEEEGEQSETE